MEENQRKQRVSGIIPTRDQLKFTHELLTWLEGLGLTLEQAEHTVQEACSLHPEGVFPADILGYFVESHNVSYLDQHRVSDLASLLVFRGRLKREKGGRYTHTRGRARPFVLAVARVPIEDWEAFRGIHGNVAAAYMVDPRDRV